MGSFKIKYVGIGRGNHPNSKKNRIQPGETLNRRGRPRKHAPSYDAAETFVNVLCKVREIGSGARKMKMNGIEMLCERIVMLIPKAKPHEALAFLRFLESDTMSAALQRRAEKESGIAPDSPYSKELLEKLTTFDKKYLIKPDTTANPGNDDSTGEETSEDEAQADPKDDLDATSLRFSGPTVPHHPEENRSRPRTKAELLKKKKDTE